MTESYDLGKGEQNGDAGRLAQRQQARRRMCYFAMAVMISLTIALAIAIVVLNQSSEEDLRPIAERRGGEAITLEEILEGDYYAKGFNGTWISDTEIMWRSSRGDLEIYDVSQDSSTVLLSKDVFIKVGTKYWLSNDRKYILYSTVTVKLYRHSNLATYRILTIASGLEFDVYPPTILPQEGPPYLQLVKWAPVGNAFVYVYERNLYYRSSAENDGSSDIALSDTEGENFNGVPDWVYEEEVLGDSRAVWFSPNGRSLAFASFNDTLVEQMPIPYYGPPSSLKFQYPRTLHIPYPKPGTPNPSVRLFVVPELYQTVAKAVELPKPSFADGEEVLFSEVVWANNSEVAVSWMNRVQNNTMILIYNKDNVQLNEATINLMETKGWVDPPQMKFSSNGTALLLVTSIDQEYEKGGYKQLAIVKTGDRAVNAVTVGTNTVLSIESWDEVENKIYYMATREGYPAQQHLFSIHTNGSNETCITCQLNNGCNYSTTDFSTSSSYYTLSCTGPFVPYISLYSTKDTLNSIVVLETNDKIQEQLIGKALPRQLNLQIPVGGGEYMAQVRLWIPPIYSADDIVKYPLLINVYAGPDSNQVNDQWRMDWGTYLSSSKDIIYGTIDGRGSGRQGDKMLFELYYRLGTVEVEDQISVVKYLQDNYDFIDSNRTAIWGWSYGGFVTAMVMATDTKGVFECGMSVAPVTNWIYYDTIYTERYMGLPTPNDNFQGYNESDVTRQVQNFNRKKYYLIHGTGDDNVHYQQSMMLSKALENYDILFRQQTYPDEDHSIAHMKPHLYHSMDEFLDECFAPS